MTYQKTIKMIASAMMQTECNFYVDDEDFLIKNFLSPFNLMKSLIETDKEKAIETAELFMTFIDIYGQATASKLEDIIVPYRDVDQIEYIINTSDLLKDILYFHTNNFIDVEEQLIKILKLRREIYTYLFIAFKEELEKT